MDTKDKDPLTDFSDCHGGITHMLNKLVTLPALASHKETFDAARKLAAELRQFFHSVVLKHHLDEEQELFAAVRDALDHNPDQAMVMRGHIGRLTEEHRYIEALWKKVEPDLKKLEKGKVVLLDGQLIQQLARDYLAHAEFEEQYFLPQSEQLLSNNELSALAMSLHIRHMDNSGMTRSGYI